MPDWKIDWKTVIVVLFAWIVLQLAKDKLNCMNSVRVRHRKSWKKNRRRLEVASLYNEKTWFCNGYVAFNKRVSKNFMK